MKAFLAFCLKRRALVAVLSAGLGALGVWAAATLPLDAIPDLSDTQVIVYTRWMGRDPQTIEDQVTYPVSSVLLKVPQVKAVRGYSFFGSSFVYVIFRDGTDIYWARSRVLEYLNQVSGQLPSGVSPAIGPDATGLGWVFMYTLEDPTGKLDLSELRALQDWYVRYQLSSVPGVAEVASVGGAVRQYQVEVDPRRLAVYGVPLMDVISAIRRSNNDVGGEVVEVAEAEFMVRGRGYVREIQDLENVVVRVSDRGVPVLVRDLANVSIGPEMKRGLADRDGRGEVVAGIVVMRLGENALAVVEAVKRRMEAVKQGLPAGVEILPMYDRSGLIRRSIAFLRTKLLEELAIVAGVCILFLWHVRSAAVAFLVAPLGLLLAFVGMRVAGVNSNIMSLAGLAVAIGAMVDASVVFVENLHKRKERLPAEEHWSAVLHASHEVGPGLFASLLVITVSFLPVFALEDQAGRLFQPLAWTKTFAMAGAALLSITLVPVLMGYFVRGRIHPESSNPVNRALIGAYLPVLRSCLSRPWLSILIAAAALGGTVPIAFRLGSEFMPSLEEGDILYMPTSLPGLSVAEARRALMTQDRLIREFPEVRSVLGKIGRAETATDPAPLSMVETTAALRDVSEWPERILPERSVRKVARRMASDAESSGFLSAGAKAARASVAADAAVMAASSANERLRKALASGRPAAEAKGELPAHLVRSIALELGGAYRARGLLDPSRDEAFVTHLVSRWTARVDAGDLPLRRTTFDELTKVEMQRAIQVPGMPNWWLQPIQTRVGMLSTGMRGYLGVKVRGPDLLTLDRIAVRLEEILRQVPGTASAVAERTLGGNFLDIELDRRACARYGLTTGDVQDVIESAIGGVAVTQTIEGRYRFPVSVRYPRELRDDPERIARTVIVTPTGGTVTLRQVANVVMRRGPDMIKSEHGMLLAQVPVDLAPDQDLGSYVTRASAEIAAAIAKGTLAIPPGYTYEWSGQYQFMQEVARKLRVIVPVTLLIVFLLLYLNMGNVAETAIAMATLPFALVGGIWLMGLRGDNWSTAVAIGFIALAGLASQTAVVMHTFLDLSFRSREAAGGSWNARRLQESVLEGAVSRVRPKMMTVMTMILGLLPILWSEGAGALTMKRIAAPVIGGLVTSTVHTLLLIPIYYTLYMRWRLTREGRWSSVPTPTRPGAPPPLAGTPTISRTSHHPMRRRPPGRTKGESR